MVNAFHPAVAETSNNLALNSKKAITRYFLYYILNHGYGTDIWEGRRATMHI